MRRKTLIENEIENFKTRVTNKAFFAPVLLKLNTFKSGAIGLNKNYKHELFMLGINAEVNGTENGMKWPGGTAFVIAVTSIHASILWRCTNKCYLHSLDATTNYQVTISADVCPFDCKFLKLL